MFISKHIHEMKGKTPQERFAACVKLYHKEAGKGKRKAHEEGKRKEQGKRKKEGKKERKGVHEKEEYESSYETY